MNSRIEENIIGGLVRLFNEYGWEEENIPPLHSSKCAYVKYWLYHGEASHYLEALQRIINNCRKSHDWGKIFNSTYVEGIRNLLKNYINKNHLDKIKYKPELLILYPTLPPTDNVFSEGQPGHRALTYLGSYDKTNISYSLVEEYGVPRLIQDLRFYYPNGDIRIRYEDHIPDQIRDWEYDEGTEKMTVFFPLMPIVLVYSGEHNHD